MPIYIKIDLNLNGTMKKQLYIIILSLFAVTGALTPASAGPFISINSIDSKTDFPRIKVIISAVDPEGRAIAGLDEGNIQVYEDGYMVNYVKVKNISSASDQLHLAFAIDSSKSISTAFLEKIKKDAKGIVDSAGNNDRIALYRFNDKVVLLNSFTSNRLELLNGIKSVERHGTLTMLYDAIYDAIDHVSRTKSIRKGVVIFTDGKDEGSNVKPDDVIKFSRDAGVPVYFITSAPAKNRGEIGRIAKLTGGVLIADGARDVAGLYRTILSRIRNTYEINYLSIVKMDSSKHDLEVRLKYGELKDRDTASFTTEKQLFRLDFPDGSYIIISIMVMGLLAVLFILLVVFFRRSKERYTKLSSREEDTGYGSTYEYPDNVSAESLLEEENFDADAPRETPDVMYSQVWLHQKEGQSIGAKIAIVKPEVTVGSGRENTIQLEDMGVSNKHARIRRVEGGYYLYDLISDRGTYLNGKKLLRPRLLRDWDEIKIGNSSFIFRGVK
jgi:VWFA-related protein